MASSETKIDGVVIVQMSTTGSSYLTPALFYGGLSGSLQRLTDGKTYLVAGPGITITSQSNGQVLITATGQVATGSITPDRQIFTGSGTWTKPNGASIVEVFLVGGGAGGGGGYQASGYGLPGGPGGGAGGKTRGFFLASDLPATASVVVGTGGSGGAGATPGVTGSAGGDSTFDALLIAFGASATVTYDALLPGDKSFGGYGDTRGGNGGDVLDSTGALPATTNTAVFFGETPGGGGAGGYKVSVSVVGPAGDGGSPSVSRTGCGAAGGVGNNGSNGSNVTTNQPQVGGGGGGGGSGAGSGGTAGNGGNGGLYGGGGGGGGAGATAGSGGNGANGIVVVVSY